jgi:hypothetical protein
LAGDKTSRPRFLMRTAKSSDALARMMTGSRCYRPLTCR